MTQVYVLRQASTQSVVHPHLLYQACTFLPTCDPEDRSKSLSGFACWANRIVKHFFATLVKSSVICSMLSICEKNLKNFINFVINRRTRSVYESWRYCSGHPPLTLINIVICVCHNEWSSEKETIDKEETKSIFVLGLPLTKSSYFLLKQYQSCYSGTY